MAAFEFPGPGFTAEQWERINALTISLKPGQGLWISGYLAGIDHGVRSLLGDIASPSQSDHSVSGVPLAISSRSLTILFGGETGNSSGLARTLGEAVRRQGLEPILVDMADYKPRKLKDEQDILIVTSTHGEGDPPLSGMGFFEFVESRKAPRLEGVRYGVLALGDSTYERYCEAGKRLDRRLAELGAVRLQDRVDCDVDYEDQAAGWIAAAVAKLAPAASGSGLQTKAAGTVSPSSAAVTDTPAFDKRKPFPAAIIDNLVLTGRGSSKETRHIELSLADSGLAFEPGDALGVMPRNDPALVEMLLSRLSLGGDASLSVKGLTTSLGVALTEQLEITAATPRFLDQWAELTGASKLQELRGEQQFQARAAFLRGHHVIDIVRDFPVPGIDAQTFAAGLRPLQPRLYSIASSPSAVPDEAHLTVATVRYDLHGQPRAGVASGHFAGRGQPDTTIPVYIQANPHFRLPDADTPIIMIAAGTGVAPYRAFLQEREAQGATGKSWLVFGERNFSSDFLYQTEWQSFLKDGALSRMNVAFSRDSDTKTYVQHRLTEHARDVYAWLEEGAHVYVCGDGTHLAPDVHAALAGVVQQQRACGKAEAADYLGSLQRDHRYQIDVY
ncbi:assimilatory sulfite reductase (NADPH) flavoprotein subunit [Mesorhizobium sp. PAMC28654]|uniref:assimilatory sulfite reductase (NADPH) flavoprotein subunit n=1 Tax=Mesorhizobium sp. PAMC28654 TaxID=2880934 RepID=UPI001D0A0E90|nr:assimilatory sulfite reductase (NADPH) flavoprotein subunit [Mesorhizobium sp. PAMC28654]UDL90457.1 assimilatory sulfite reductase (NADPH) flavoprotein subunit [Mesorhizobium sp. PAMC28654]